MLFFFLHSTISHSTLLLFSRSDHCHLWKGVMRELLEVTLQRRFNRDRTNLKKKTRSPLRPSALSEIVGLMQSRSLWPSVMRELAEKYEFKKIECDSIVSPPSQKEATVASSPSSILRASSCEIETTSEQVDRHTRKITIFFFLQSSLAQVVLGYGRTRADDPETTSEQVDRHTRKITIATVATSTTTITETSLVIRDDRITFQTDRISSSPPLLIHRPRIGRPNSHRRHNPLGRPCCHYVCYRT